MPYFRDFITSRISCRATITSTIRLSSTIGASGNRNITAVKPIAREMLIPCDRMIVNHLSIEVETEAQRCSNVLNRSQQLRNDTSSQQAATSHNGRNNAQQNTSLRKGAKQVRNRSQGDKTERNGTAKRRFVLTTYKATISEIRAHVKGPHCLCLEISHLNHGHGIPSYF